MTTDDASPVAPQLTLFPGLDAGALPRLLPDLPIGTLYATRGAIAYMQRHGVSPGALLGRHVFGDPGELDAHDVAANVQARADGTRVLSAYAYGADRERIWLITEADRSCTTLLLPDEY